MIHEWDKDGMAGSIPDQRLRSVLPIRLISARKMIPGDLWQ